MLLPRWSSSRQQRAVSAGSWGRGWHESIWGDGSEGLDKGVPGPHFACDSPPRALPESTVSISFTPPMVLWLPGKHKSHAAEETWHPPAAAGNVPLLYLQLRALRSARVSADLGTVCSVDPTFSLDGSETLASKLLSGYGCAILVQFSRSVVSDSLRPHGLQQARPPCPSPAPGVCSNSCPLSQ